jgi:hypothetical protein
VQWKPSILPCSNTTEYRKYSQYVSPVKRGCTEHFCKQTHELPTPVSVTPLPSSYGWTPTLNLDCSGYIHSSVLPPAYPDTSQCNTKKLHNYDCYYFCCYNYWYRWHVTNTPSTSKGSILYFCGSKNVQQSIHLFFCISIRLAIYFGYNTSVSWLHNTINLKHYKVLCTMLDLL